MTYRHLAFLGQESSWAAEAANCAAEQDRFWDYHHALYESQRGRNQGTFSKDNLKRLAGQAGIDRAAFDACVDTGKFAESVRAETEAGRQKGVARTPTIFVNGQKIEGAPTFEVLTQMIEQAAASRR